MSNYTTIGMTGCMHLSSFWEFDVSGRCQNGRSWNTVDEGHTARMQILQSLASSRTVKRIAKADHKPLNFLLTI